MIAWIQNYKRAKTPWSFDNHSVIHTLHKGGPFGSSGGICLRKTLKQ